MTQSRRRSPRDLSREVEVNPFLGLLMSDPAGIEASERQGQREVLGATTLPTQMMSPREEFEALGFTFGEVVPGDPIFQEATLPIGWRREGTGHPMWTRIVDERGVERVSLFYKAAFYDRDAHMGLVNVGANVAQKVLYGDQDLERDEVREGLRLQLSVLTPAELADVQASLDRMRGDITRSPDIYGKYGARTDALQAILTACLEAQATTGEPPTPE